MNLDPRTDRELLDRWRTGDREAGRELFDRWLGSLLRFFLGKTEAGPEEIVQEAMLAVLEGRERFAEELGFRVHLFRVAYVALCEHWRARAGERFDPWSSSVFDLGAAASTLSGSGAQQRRLVEALRRSPLATQTLLELVYFEGMKAEELASVLDIPQGAVRRRLWIGQELLRQWLSE